MRHSRKLALASVSLAFTMTAAACGGDDSESTDTTTAPAADATTTTAASTDTTAAGTDTTAAGGEAAEVILSLMYDEQGRGDRSFNDSAAAGLDKAKAEFPDMKVTEVPAAGGDRSQLINAQISAGSNLIIGVGFAWGDAIAAACAANPEINFAIVDGFVEGCDNVSILAFKEQEGSFLVGAAAALKSTNGHVGFIGGQEIPLIGRFEAGFKAGAKAVNPDVKFESSYLGPAGDNTAWGNAPKAKETALSFYQKGADVIYTAAGGSGLGTFEAAKEFSAGGSKVWAIGVDSDQYQTVSPDLQQYILTSMLKRVDTSVYETLKDANGGMFAGGVRVFDLASDGVGYATSGDFVTDIASQLDDWAAQIIDGSITVPEDPAAA
jgi:basic membrane protein A and related proteins